MLIKILLLLTILLYFHPINNSIAGSCDEKASSGETSTCTGNFNIPSNWSCPENLSLEYDTTNSNETIDRNGSANLVFTGDDGPYYTWTVSGQGFWFDDNHTVKTLTNNGLTATLYADDSACGAATIEVTACSGGTPEIGYVRCTKGQWGSYLTACGQSVYVPGNNVCTSIDGKTKYTNYQSCVKEIYCVCEEMRTCTYDPYSTDNCLGGCSPCYGTEPLNCRHGTYWIRKQEWVCP